MRCGLQHPLARRAGALKAALRPHTAWSRHGVMPAQRLRIPRPAGVQRLMTPQQALFNENGSSSSSSSSSSGGGRDPRGALDRSMLARAIATASDWRHVTSIAAQYGDSLDSPSAVLMLSRLRQLLGQQRPVLRARDAAQLEQLVGYLQQRARAGTSPSQGAMAAAQQQQRRQQALEEEARRAAAAQARRQQRLEQQQRMQQQLVGQPLELILRQAQQQGLDVDSLSQLLSALSAAGHEPSREQLRPLLDAAARGTPAAHLGARGVRNSTRALQSLRPDMAREWQERLLRDSLREQRPGGAAALQQQQQQRQQQQQWREGLYSGQSARQRSTRGGFDRASVARFLAREVERAAASGSLNDVATAVQDYGAWLDLSHLAVLVDGLAEIQRKQAQGPGVNAFGALQQQQQQQRAGLRRVADALCRIARAALPDAPACDVVLMLQALSRLQAYDADLVSAALERCSQDLAALDVSQLGTLLHSLAVLGCRPSAPWLLRFLQASGLRLSRCSLVDLERMATALIMMRQAPGGAWLAAAEARLHDLGVEVVQQLRGSRQPASAGASSSASALGVAGMDEEQVQATLESCLKALVLLGGPRARQWWAHYSRTGEMPWVAAVAALQQQEVAAEKLQRRRQQQQERQQQAEEHKNKRQREEEEQRRRQQQEQEQEEEEQQRLLLRRKLERQDAFRRRSSQQPGAALRSIDEIMTSALERYEEQQQAQAQRQRAQQQQPPPPQQQQQQQQAGGESLLHMLEALGVVPQMQEVPGAPAGVHLAEPPAEGVCSSVAAASPGSDDGDEDEAREGPDVLAAEPAGWASEQMERWGHAARAVALQEKGQRAREEPDLELLLDEDEEGEEEDQAEVVPVWGGDAGDGAATGAKAGGALTGAIEYEATAAAAAAPAPGARSTAEASDALQRLMLEVEQQQDSDGVGVLAEGDEQQQEEQDAEDAAALAELEEVSQLLERATDQLGRMDRAATAAAPMAAAREQEAQSAVGGSRGKSAVRAADGVTSIPPTTGTARVGSSGVPAFVAAAKALQAEHPSRNYLSGCLEGISLELQKARAALAQARMAQQQRVLKRQLAAPEDPYARQLQQLQVDFERFRQRAEMERKQARSTAAADAASLLLPLLDSFERAEQQLALATPFEVQSDAERLIHSAYQALQLQLRGILVSHGVEAVEVREGALFDPQVHEAVMREPAPPGVQDGAVLRELRRGYQVGGRLLRPSLVVVAYTK